MSLGSVQSDSPEERKSGGGGGATERSEAAGPSTSETATDTIGRGSAAARGLFEEVGASAGKYLAVDSECMGGGVDPK